MKNQDEIKKKIEELRKFANEIAVHINSDGKYPLREYAGAVKKGFLCAQIEILNWVFGDEVDSIIKETQSRLIRSLANSDILFNKLNCNLQDSNGNIIAKITDFENFVLRNGHIFSAVIKKLRVVNINQYDFGDSNLININNFRIFINDTEFESLGDCNLEFNKSLIKIHGELKIVQKDI